MNDGIGLTGGRTTMGKIKTPYELRRAVDERVAGGYAATGEGLVGRRRDEKVAMGYRPDERMERMLRLRGSDPAAFAALMRDPSRRAALGFYENAKAAARRLEGADRG